ncbi:MAG: serine/threonine protein kinase [Deltaproteobacteria bacterium]|nr:MAG: serine/threonine protein kinase [Deltaproteobacteria bacterium]
MAPRLTQQVVDLFGLEGLDEDSTAYVDDRYRILRTLGEGAFGTVLLCADEGKQGRLVAVKGLVSPSPTCQRSLMHEFVNARRLRHPQLVSVLDTGVCPRRGIYVVLEYVDGPDLVTVLDEEDRIDVDVAAEICRQIARGLSHMHRQDLVHRDVKPDNVYLEGATAKLGDFGASRARKQQGRATVIFTPGYAPPEAQRGTVGVEADAYALGALFHLAVTGRLPPTPGPRSRSPRVSPLLRRYGGARAEQLARRLLHPKPTQRLSDMQRIQQRFAALVRSNSRRKLRELVERVNLKRQRAHLEKRWAEFEQRFGEAMRPFGLDWVCVECRGPVSEGMLFCPWCGDLLRFRSDASFPRYCQRCEHGLHEAWAVCPWCGERYGATPAPGTRRARDRRYEDHCQACSGPLMRYMSFCPWCGEGYTWHTPGMEETCPGCGFSVAGELFGYCPFCGEVLNEAFAQQASERIHSLKAGRRSRRSGAATRGAWGQRRRHARFGADPRLSRSR